MLTIRYEEKLPPVDLYWPLFVRSGWSDRYQINPHELAQALKGSWYAVSAWEGQRLVGFGRVVGDGVLHAMIHEMMVEPDYQNQGIGSKILEMLVSRCSAAGIRDVSLLAAPGRADYYRRRGFVARPEDAPGMRYRPAPPSAG